jgi:RecA-family ATPase
MRPEALPAEQSTAPSENGQRPAAGLIRRAASEIPMRRTVFLDDAKMLPRASLVVVAGRAGLGKTLYANTLTAAATTGSLAGIDGAVDVLYSTGEDDPETVLVPRMKAAGADLERVHFTEYRLGEDVAQSLTLPDDVDQLAIHARETKAALIVIDPIAAHLSGEIDSHRDADVRRALAPLASLARELGLTVLVIAHLRKGGGVDPLSRVSGSGAFGNAPRSVMVFGTDPDDEDGERGNRRVIAHAKSNVAPKAESIACHIEVRDIPIEGAPFGVPVLTLDGSSPHDAADVLDHPGAEAHTEREEAKNWLLAELVNPIRSRELQDAAKRVGITLRTLERAKKDLGVKSLQGPDGWYTLPPGEETL